MNHFTKSDNGTYYYLVVNERLFILTPYDASSRWDKYHLSEKTMSEYRFKDACQNDCYVGCGTFPSIKSAEEYIREDLGVVEHQPAYETWSVHVK